MKDGEGDALIPAGQSGPVHSRGTRRPPSRTWQAWLRRLSVILVVALSAALVAVLVQRRFGAASVSAPAPPRSAAVLVATGSPTPSSIAAPPAALPQATATFSPSPSETETASPRAITHRQPRRVDVDAATLAGIRSEGPPLPGEGPRVNVYAALLAEIKPEGPPLLGEVPRVNVYAATLAGKLSPAVAGLPVRVYVPNSGDGTIDVINPATFQVVDRYFVGAIPHHITPAWDLTRLYVETEGSSSMTVIDPRTGKPAGTIPVANAYNLYFTPDGRKAIVVVERFSRLEFRDPHTWRLLKSVYIPWSGVDHLDFSADGRYFLVSTEYSGIVVKVDTVAMKITGWINVGGLPIDVRLAPDGSVFYVANQGRNGVSIIDPVAMKEVGFVPTGRGAHGLEVSRDTKSLYVCNRLAGTISVISFRTRRVTAVWRVGISPDMMQLSPDGRQLWVSGRYDSAVYVVDTRTGMVLHTIAVGLWPHGLSYFPNAGRFSLGHNGNYR